MNDESYQLEERRPDAETWSPGSGIYSSLRSAMSTAKIVHDAESERDHRVVRLPSREVVFAIRAKIEGERANRLGLVLRQDLTGIPISEPWGGPTERDLYTWAAEHLRQLREGT